MASSPSARRRPPSSRVAAAVVCLSIAVALVAAALASQSTPMTVVAAVGAVVLGIAATMATHSALMHSRRETFQVRANEAKAFGDLSRRRTAENEVFVDSMLAQVSRHKTALGQLEEALCAAQARAADATRKLKVEQRRAELAEAKTEHASRKLDDAEERAAEAVIRVAELEQERDVMRAELDSWRAVGVENFRKHA